MANSSEIEETVKNSSTNNNEESNRPACAACKHQRKKCRKGCLFLSYFPSNKQQEFSAVHQIFGIANVTKMMKDIVLDKRSEVVASIIWEAMIWTNKDHREYGPLGIFRKLEEDNTNLLEEVKRLNENLKECQNQLQQYQKEDEILNENLIKYQQQMLENQGQSQCVLPVVVSNPSSLPGEFSKTVNSRNNNNAGFSHQHPEHLQVMVTQNTMPPASRSPLENITNRSNVSRIHTSNPNWRLNRQRYEPYHQQFIRGGGFIEQQHFVLSNQSQENNFASIGVFGQQNHSVNIPVQSNFTAEQQTQWKSS